MERYSRVKNAILTCGKHGIGKEVARGPARSRLLRNEGEARASSV